MERCARHWKLRIDDKRKNYMYGAVTLMGQEDGGRKTEHGGRECNWGFHQNGHNHWELHSAMSFCLTYSLKQKGLLVSKEADFSPLIIPSRNVLESLLELLRSLELNSPDLEQYFPRCEMLQIRLGDAQVWQIKLNHMMRKLFLFQFSFHPSDDTKDKFSVWNRTSLTPL